MQLEIERMQRLLEPRQPVGRQSLDIAQGGDTIECAVAVDRQAHAGLEYAQHRLDAPEIDAEFGAADLDLEAPIALRDGAANILAQSFEVVGVPVVAAAGIDLDHRPG